MQVWFTLCGCLYDTCRKNVSRRHHPLTSPDKKKTLGKLQLDVAKYKRKLFLFFFLFQCAKTFDCGL
jgi:hypothetical protein